MAKGTIFHTLAEGPISFLPTYKFEKGCQSNALQPFYDQGEKKRVPAWTDRVFFRGSGPQQNALQPNPVQQKSDVRVSVLCWRRVKVSTWLAAVTWLIALAAQSCMLPQGTCTAVWCSGEVCTMWWLHTCTSDEILHVATHMPIICPSRLCLSLPPLSLLSAARCRLLWPAVSLTTPSWR